MRTVDEIYPFGINTTIGPTGTIKRLFQNHEYFIERGYDMTIYALQSSHKSLIGQKMALSRITHLPEVNSASTTSVKNTGNRGLRGILKANKHAFVVNHYFTSVLSHRLSLRFNANYIKSYLKEGRTPDVIVFHEMDSCYHYLKYRTDNDSKIVMFLHADGSDGDMFGKRFPKLEGKKDHQKLVDNLFYCYEHCDSIVWISKLAKERFCHNHPEYAYKAVAVVNGIDDKPYVKNSTSSSFKYRLVTTGTVCERKGQYIIVEAMHKMNPTVLKDTHLTIIGSGPDHARLVGLSEKYGLNDHISFLGNVLNSKVHELLCAENIFVLMSNNEGLPISILEAMRAGLPVISTKVAGIPEEVDVRNGQLIDPEIDQLTKVLNHLPELNWEELGKASRERFVNEFTFEIMRQNYANMFDKVLSV